MYLEHQPESPHPRDLVPAVMYCFPSLPQAESAVPPALYNFLYTHLLQHLFWYSCVLPSLSHQYSYATSSFSYAFLHPSREGEKMMPVKKQVVPLFIKL